MADERAAPPWPWEENHERRRTDRAGQRSPCPRQTHAASRRTRNRARSGRLDRRSARPGEIRAPDIAGLRPESAVAALVDHAARLGASDLFFSFNDNHVAVSVRHLGIVRLLTILTTEHGRRCTSYIKAMAGMDLAEQRRPLDGRWVREDDTLPLWRARG